MRATQFEFNQRFWLIGLIIWAGFSSPLSIMSMRP